MKLTRSCDITSFLKVEQQARHWPIILPSAHVLFLNCTEDDFRTIINGSPCNPDMTSSCKRIFTYHKERGRQTCLALRKMNVIPVKICLRSRIDPRLTSSLLKLGSSISGMNLKTNKQNQWEVCSASVQVYIQGMGYAVPLSFRRG